MWAEGGHAGQIQAVALSPDETLVASASSDGIIKLWSFGDMSPLRSLAGHSNWLNSLALSPDGQFLASGSGDRTIRLWRGSDCTLLAVANANRDIQLVRLADGAVQRTLRGHLNAIAR